MGKLVFDDSGKSRSHQAAASNSKHKQTRGRPSADHHAASLPLNGKAPHAQQHRQQHTGKGPHHQHKPTARQGGPAHKPGQGERLPKPGQKRKERVDEDSEFYRRALKRMEMGPQDDGDGDSMSDLSEEPGRGPDDFPGDYPAPGASMRPQPWAAPAHRQPQQTQHAGRRAAETGRNGFASKGSNGYLEESDGDDDEIQGSESGSEEGASDGSHSDEHGSEGVADDDGSDSDSEELGVGDSDDSLSEDDDGLPPRQLQQLQLGRLSSKAAGGGEDSDSDDDDMGGDSAGGSDDGEGEESAGEDGNSDDSDASDADDDPDGFMQQLQELPLEQRLALLQDGTGPRGQAARAAAQAAKEQEASFKRLNKHRPQEMSSKRPVSRFRVVVEPTQKVGKDPRFARLTNDKEKEIAARRYSFLYDDVLAKEKAELKAKIKKEKKPHVQAALSGQLQRLEQALSREQQRRTRQEVEQKFKAQQRKAVEAGKSPYYLKDSDKKKLELVAKYEQLKKAGRLDRYMEKRRKHNASKDHRYLPAGRRGQEDAE